MDSKIRYLLFFILANSNRYLEDSYLLFLNNKCISFIRISNFYAYRNYLISVPKFSAKTLAGITFEK